MLVSGSISSMSCRSNHQNDPFSSSRKRKSKKNINKKLDTPTKNYFKESMKGWSRWSTL